jgi:ferrochelatase
VSAANLPYQAVLVVSFGGPEGPADVLPFLENVLRGRNVPRERVLEVARHYQQFGGVSPLNAQNRQLAAALRDELAAHGPALPVYLGNRNCRQYRETIEAARAAVGPDAPQIDRLRAFYNHPGFIGPMIERVRAALDQVPAERRAAAHLVYTAHSIPLAMARGCRYEEQLTETARLVNEGLGGGNPWRLVYQSRSGPPVQPWLGPDVCDYLRELHTAGARDVVVAPIGFLSDHIEILYDLDTQARQVCRELGLNMVRAQTVGSHPEFVKMIRELIVERFDPSVPRRAIGRYGPPHDVCPPDCCPSGRASGFEKQSGG